MQGGGRDHVGPRGGGFLQERSSTGTAGRNQLKSELNELSLNTTVTKRRSSAARTAGIT